LITECLQRHPFLRLLMPLAGGIVCADWLFFSHYTDFLPFFASVFHHLPFEVSTDWYYPALLLFLCLLFFSGLLIVSLLFRYSRFHELQGILISLIFFGLGFLVTNHSLHCTDFPFSGVEQTYKAVIVRNPELKERSIMCRSVVTGEFKANSLNGSSRKSVFLLYFPKDSVSLGLRRGDQLLVHTRLVPPTNNGNPDEFDYVRYLIRRGGSGTAYVAAGHWSVLRHELAHTMQQRALGCRESVERLYRDLGFSGNRLAVLSALTVGDKDELSDEIRETYSISGASHVLALSGLHVGLLYALFLFFVRPLWKRHSFFKPLSLLLLIVALWAFALFTGLSPSVVRSVIMFSLLAVSCLQSGRQLSLNTLALTALLMLIYNPLWIFDVGFQLSFSAVASILLIQPKLYHLVAVKQRFLRYIWGLATLSVAAQIGTAPLTIFYFSRFPVHFLLTGLWLIPLVTLILYSAVLMLLLTPFPLLQHPFAQVVNLLIDSQNHLLYGVSRLPFASINALSLDAFEVFLLYLFLLLLFRGFAKRTFRSVCCFLLCLLILVSYDVALDFKTAPRRSIVFYNCRNCPAIHCLTGANRSWLVCADTVPDVSRMSRMLSRHWNRMQLSKPEVIAGVGDYSASMLSVHHQLLTYGNKTICLLNSNCWRTSASSRPLSIDYLYVSKGYTGRLTDLKSVFLIHAVVLDSSLSAYRTRKLEAECLRLDIPYTVLTESGALSIDV